MATRHPGESRAHARVVETGDPVELVGRRSMDGSPVDARPSRPGVAAGPSLDRALAEGWAVDLHTHSRHSDGVWTPRELVEEAGRRGVRVLALTDHDGVGGQAEVVGAAARAGLLAITGVEITTRLGDRVYHLLCYDLDPADPVWLEIERRRRTTRQPLPVEELARLLPDGAGLLSVAHPGRDERGVSHRLTEADLTTLTALLPLVALEAQHPYHAPLDVELFRHLAAERGLAVTCGSDAHGWHGRRMPIAHPAELARGFLELLRARGGQAAA